MTDHHLSPASRRSPLRLLLRSCLSATLLASLTLSGPASARLMIGGGADEQPREPMPLETEVLRYLNFGEIINDFYADRQFAAIVKLLINQKSDLFNEHTEYAELMLGELYVNFGLPQQAEVIFNRLLKKDILAQLRAETWLQKAGLHYRRGEIQAAEQILTGNQMNTLSVEKSAQRHLMLANIYIGQGNFSGALTSLYAIPTGTLEGAYATYNMGVAMVRADHVADGLKILGGVVNLAAGDEEINSLKDRAALAIGLTELQHKNYEAARQALLTVRADGPYSNEALLALGLSNFQRGDARRAIPLWLELSRRDSRHQSVQEALMLAPRAFEEVGGNTQALAGYTQAAAAYRNELQRIEQSIRNVSDRNWLERVKRYDKEGASNPDPMARYSYHIAEDGPEMAYLYRLFASHAFAEEFRVYMELDRILVQLLNWQEALPVFQNTYQTQVTQLNKVLPGISQKLADLKRLNDTNAIAIAELSVNIPMRVDMRQPQDVANFEQLQRWEIMEQLNQAGLSATQRERLRRVRGVLLFDIANKSQQSRQQQINDSRTLVSESELIDLRLQALTRQVRDANLHVRSDLGNRIRAQSSKVEGYVAETRRLMELLGQSIRNQALEVLAEKRVELGSQLADAHLAIARLQDATITERLDQRNIP